ncbi:MAG: hypothetical protein AAF799_29605 [Myxococcota bacterium]
MMRTTVPFALACLLAYGCDSKKDAGPTADAKVKESPKEAKRDARAEVAKAVDEAKAAKDKRAKAKDAKAEETYGEEFCAVIIPCFQEMKFVGNFMADVSVDIEPEGSVSAVSFTGDAPKPVQTCINTKIKATTLADYNGKPGRTKCTKSGQLMGGGQMVMSDMSYEVREAAGGDAKAADAE